MPLPPQLQPKTRQCRCPPEAGRSSNLSSRCLGLGLQWFRCHCRVVKQVSISSRDGQAPCDHNSTTNLLNRLNLPAPTRGTMVKVTGNGVPGAVGKGRGALLLNLDFVFSSFCNSEKHHSVFWCQPKHNFRPVFKHTKC